LKEKSVEVLIWITGIIIEFRYRKTAKGIKSYVIQS